MEVKKDIINLMVSDLIQRAASEEARMWNGQITIEQLYEKKLELSKKFTESFANYIIRESVDFAIKVMSETIKQIQEEKE